MHYNYFSTRIHYYTNALQWSGNNISYYPLDIKECAGCGIKLPDQTRVNSGNHYLCTSCYQKRSYPMRTPTRKPVSIMRASFIQYTIFIILYINII